MEPTTNDNSSAKIIAALIIGLIVGFLAGAFWQARRVSAPVLDSAAAVMEATESTAATAEENAAMQSQAGEAATKTETKTETKSGMPTSTVRTSMSKTPLAGSPELSVVNQDAGSTVRVSVRHIADPVWVAVRDLKDGKVGNILGAHKVFTGEDTSIVELLRPTVAGAMYKVVLYKDIGDPAFNYREDVLIEGVEATFKAK